MSYKVIHNFHDLQDSCHSYRVGDMFPRPGKNVSDNRINELLGKQNKQGKPLIVEVAEEIPATALFSKTDINRMPIAELKNLAKAKGIVGAEDMTGATLKRELISMMGL